MRKFLASLLSFLAVGVCAQSPRDEGQIRRFALMAVGSVDFYVPLLSTYPLEPAARQPGPDNRWFRGYWLPTGQNLSNWSEMQAVLQVAGNVDPLQIVAAQLRTICPSGLVTRQLEAPRMHSSLEALASSVITCQSSSTSSFGGYFLSVRDSNYRYLLSIELRGPPEVVLPRLAKPEESVAGRALLDFATCEKNTVCITK